MLSSARIKIYSHFVSLYGKDSMLPIHPTEHKQLIISALRYMHNDGVLRDCVDQYAVVFHKKQPNINIKNALLLIDDVLALHL